MNYKKLLPGSRAVQGTLCIAFGIAVAFAAIPAGARDNAKEGQRNMGKAFVSIAQKVSPSVVFIKVEKKLKNIPRPEFLPPFYGDFFERFFSAPSPQEQPPWYRQSPRQEGREVGQGSGFIISSDGYILTNNHVVGNTNKVTVKLKDSREFTAKIIGADSHSDVAVIKIDAENLPVLPLGDSDALEVGEWVMAVGNPFGLSHTVTVGVVSAKGRGDIGVTDYENFIQTDAAINPGNSGGPLVDQEGRVVGVNTAIFTQSGGSMGIGFAIPINMVKAVKDQLIEKGSVTRGYLGISIQELNSELKKTFGLSQDSKGILIAQVNEDSPAQKAGLKRGDVIIEFEGKPVEKIGAFRNRVALKAPGTKEMITILRDGKRLTLTVTLGQLTGENNAAIESPLSLRKLGMSVRTLDKDLAKKFGYQGMSGVLVTNVVPLSLADSAGIRRGFLIHEVNREWVTNVEEFQHAMNQTPEHGTVLMLIREGDSSRYVTLRYLEQE